MGVVENSDLIIINDALASGFDKYKDISMFWGHHSIPEEFFHL